VDRIDWLQGEQVARDIVTEVHDNDDDARSPRWDISQERAFIETLLGQRLNFLLLFYSITVAGAVNAGNKQILQAIVLSVGFLIALLLTLAISRAQQKLDLILEHLYKNPSHPAGFINKQASGKSRRKLIGYAIPVVCTAFLGTWAVLSWVGLAWAIAAGG
jgi:hypothetical protein